eukprot:gene11680-4187_t
MKTGWTWLAIGLEFLQVGRKVTSMTEEFVKLTTAQKRKLHEEEQMALGAFLELSAEEQGGDTESLARMTAGLNRQGGGGRPEGDMDPKQLEWDSDSESWAGSALCEKLAGSADAPAEPAETPAEVPGEEAAAAGNGDAERDAAQDAFEREEAGEKKEKKGKKEKKKGRSEWKHYEMVWCLIENHPNP